MMTNKIKIIILFLWVLYNSSYFGHISKTNAELYSYMVEI
jgi:hypothetical protein